MNEQKHFAVPYLTDDNGGQEYRCTCGWKSSEWHDHSETGGKQSMETRWHLFADHGYNVKICSAEAADYPEGSKERTCMESFESFESVDITRCQR